MKKKKDVQNEQLLKVFPEITVSDAQKVDIEIKEKIISYQSNHIVEDIAECLQNEVTKYISCKNKEKVKKRCKKLADDYWKENKTWEMQENWFCVLAYTITVVTMVLRVLEVDTAMNDRITLGAYFFALVLWLMIVRTRMFMGKKIEKIFIAFNNHAPALIIFSSLIFYFAVVFFFGKSVWVGCNNIFSCYNDMDDEDMVFAAEINSVKVAK